MLRAFAASWIWALGELSQRIVIVTIATFVAVAVGCVLIIVCVATGVRWFSSSGNVIDCCCCRFLPNTMPALVGAAICTLGGSSALITTASALGAFVNVATMSQSVVAVVTVHAQVHGNMLMVCLLADSVACAACKPSANGTANSVARRRWRCVSVLCPRERMHGHGSCVFPVGARSHTGGCE